MPIKKNSSITHPHSHPFFPKETTKIAFLVPQIIPVGHFRSTTKTTAHSIAFVNS